MTSYSSTVRVLSVRGEDFGSVATIAPAAQPGAGIDVQLAGPTDVHITEDAAETFCGGAELTMTFEAR